MSAKNKIQNKAARRAERNEGDAAWASFQRTSLSQFPRVAAINVLASCLHKSTSPRRKRFARALSSRIEVPRLKAKDPAVKLTLDLQKSPLIRVIRTIQQSARQAATCGYLAQKCTPGSQVQQNLLAAQTYHLGVMRQARAEYNFRTSPRA